jgi:DNA-binding CsgD family transcriptional regulator
MRTSVPTDRELQILAAAVIHAGTAPAAKAMGISEATANSHLEMLFCKLGVSSRIAAVCKLWTDERFQELLGGVDDWPCRAWVKRRRRYSPNTGSTAPVAASYPQKP